MFSISKSTKQTHHKKEYPQGHWAIEKALNITNHLKNVDERIPGPPPQERLKWPALAMVSGGTDEEKLEVSNMAKCACTWAQPLWKPLGSRSQREKYVCPVTQECQSEVQTQQILVLVYKNV